MMIFIFPISDHRKHEGALRGNCENEAVDIFPLACLSTWRLSCWRGPFDSVGAGSTPDQYRSVGRGYIFPSSSLHSLSEGFDKATCLHVTLTTQLHSVDSSLAWAWDSSLAWAWVLQCQLSFSNMHEPSQRLTEVYPIGLRQHVDWYSSFPNPVIRVAMKKHISPVGSVVAEHTMWLYDHKAVNLSIWKHVSFFSKNDKRQ